tara:strand:+ start:1764 stop:1907 length:144 start_codon:yes stop_codon:yes gene_type:complete
MPNTLIKELKSRLSEKLEGYRDEYNNICFGNKKQKLYAIYILTEILD